MTLTWLRDINCNSVIIVINNHCSHLNNQMYTAPLCWVLPIPHNQVNPFHIPRNQGPKKLSNLPELSKLVRSKARVWLNTCYVPNHQSTLALQTRCCSSPPGLEIRIIWGDLKNTDKSFPRDELRISLFF